MKNIVFYTRLTISFIAITCLLQSCASSYKNLTPIESDSKVCLSKLQPKYTRSLYAAQVDVTSHHLSGLLLIKQMPDSSIRLVFTTEAGFKFFDFEFAANDAFTVHYVMDKLDKKAVIKTLRKDFEMMLMRGIDHLPIDAYERDSLIYHRISRSDAYDYYLTDQNCSELVRAEKTGGRKTIVIMTMQQMVDGIPKKIEIVHQNFNFHISLHTLEQ